MVYFVSAGSVYHVDESCRLKRQFVAEAGVKKLLFYDDKNLLVTVTTSLMLTLHSVSSEGDTTETMKVLFHFVN